VLTVRDHIKALIAGMESPPRAVVIDMGAQDAIDVTSREVTRGLLKELHEKGITIYLADVHAPLLEIAKQDGLLPIIGEEQVYPSVDTAVLAIEAS
jgi:MFS superfamily sulfate permease-like transporter